MGSPVDLLGFKDRSKEKLQMSLGGAFNNKADPAIKGR